MPCRRVFLHGAAAVAAGAVCGAWPRGTRAAPVPNPATLLTAGPEGGAASHWARVLAPVLSRSLLSGAPLLRETVGGEDGVTGANQFEARVAPDGGTVLLLPGSAALAWLVGDPRAQFDAAGWIPALATVSAGVVASRQPLDRLRPGQRLRVAASGPAGAELPALLLLEMLGVEVVPVFGLTDEAGMIDAVLSGTADAAFLRGARVMEQAQTLSGAGIPAILTMGASEANQARDPMFPGIPSVAETLGRLAQHPLYPSLRAVSAAAQTEVALVLPRLAPAGMVALWRKACGQAIATAEVQDEAARRGVRPLAPAAATASTAAIAANQATLLLLRRWLADRWNWRPA